MIPRHLLRPAPAVALLLSVGALGIALVARPAAAKKYPEPSVYPIAWELKFKHGLPKRVAVKVPGKDVPQPYWYMTYTVTNDTGKEQDFLPDFQMVANDGKIHPADKNIPLAAFQAIRKREGNDLLQSAIQIAGPLHQGEDQAKDGVAIWEEPLARMSSFSIYVGNLSGEFVQMKDDKGAAIKDAEGKQIILRKTLELNFVVWGDEVRPDTDEVHDKPERWVMR